MAVALIVFLTAINLRGVRESGTAFAIPVYAFMLAIIGMGIYGFVRHFPATLPAGRERRPRHSSPTGARASPGSPRPSCCCARSPPAAPP